VAVKRESGAATTLGVPQSARPSGRPSSRRSSVARPLDGRSENRRAPRRKWGVRTWKRRGGEQTTAPEGCAGSESRGRSSKLHAEPNRTRTKAPAPKPSRGGANLTPLATTAQFYLFRKEMLRLDGSSLALDGQLLLRVLVYMILRCAFTISFDLLYYRL